MPYCTGCGKQVAAEAAFCPGCGGRQPAAAERPASGLESLPPSTAAALCYAPFFGWVIALIVLSSERFRGPGIMRFHAFQGLYLAIGWLVVDFALIPFFGFAGPAVRRALSGSLRLAIVAAMCYMLFKTFHNEFVKIPFVGDLAGKSAEEQGFRV